MAEQANETDEEEQSGSGISRRKFLKGVAAGAVAAGVLAATPSVLTAGTQVSEGDEAQFPRGVPNGPIVLYVRDAEAGEVGILSGTKEVVRRDPALVSRLKGSGVR